jgi:signal transduction histidine kinase
VRQITTDLRPVLLDDFGLVPALEWLVSEWEHRTGISCGLTGNLELADSLSKANNTAVFRIVQEALTNVSQHAAATQVEVTVDDVDGTLWVRVKDNGRGITESEINHPAALGLLGMRERALPGEGEVDIRGVTGEGTTVTLKMPLNQTSGGTS